MSASKQGSVFSYSIGFILSLFFTLVPYILVTRDVTDAWVVPIALAIFAVGQVFVQLLFFLHLGQEKKPRWKNMSFAFMLMVLVIFVFGSLWIMNNLDYHMKSPSETNRYVQQEEGISR
jgi:cytochrome o ubiquinol oxidase operon protein cyoD